MSNSIKTSVQPWEVLSREQVFKKYSRTIDCVMFRLPDGQESDFYIKSEGPAVAVFAYTPDRQIVLFEQFRPGPMKVLRELPGGGMNRGEKPHEAGLRELLEETGYTGEATYIGSMYDCGYSETHRASVIVANATRVAEPSLDATEFGRTVLVSLSEFRELLRSGNMTDVEVGYRCLDHLGWL